MEGTGNARTEKGPALWKNLAGSGWGTFHEVRAGGNTPVYPITSSPPPIHKSESVFLVHTHREGILTATARKKALTNHQGMVEGITNGSGRTQGLGMGKARQ